MSKDIYGNDSDSPDKLDNPATTSYGPAQARSTKSPISFDPLAGGLQGAYHPGILNSIISAVTGRAPAPGNIQVDPNNTNNVGRIIRHEETHDILNRLGTAKSRQIAQSSPLYNQVAAGLPGAAPGLLAPSENPSDEAIPFMASYEKSDQGYNPSFPYRRTSETSVAPQTQADYLKYVKDQLMAFPDLKKMVGQVMR